MNEFVRHISPTGEVLKGRYARSIRRCFRAIAVVIASMAISLSSDGAILSYDVTLNGPNESPPNASLGTGIGHIDYNNSAHTLQLQVTFSGLTGNTTASHIHSPTAAPGTGTAGVATTTPTFAGFPLGVTSGSYSNTLDLTLSSSWNPSFVTANGGTTAGAESALASGIASGSAYLNIHSSSFPGGEIRGFFVPVPEPSSVVLLLFGGPALVWVARRRKRASPGS